MIRRRRRLGLRPRLLIALLVISAVTLATAAATLLPPLQDRLRRESARSLEAAAIAARPALNGALQRSGGQADLRLVGLRPRLLLALLVTSAVTLAAAAAALLPPLQDRLRRESARSNRHGRARSPADDGFATRRTARHAGRASS
jgi:hypothetical protein